MKRKKVGLALGSGGWRGLAHVGVIKALIKNNIPIDYIAGCSVGALVGGFYCAFGDVSNIEDIVKNISPKMLRKLLFDFSPSAGFISGKKLLNFLDDHLKGINIEDLKTPFTASCVDLITDKPVIIKNGPLSHAIRASVSIPLIFEPVRHNGSFIVDGGAYAPIPTVISRDMGSDIVIGVNLYNNIFPFKKEYLKRGKLTKISTLRISYQMLLYNLASRDLKEADIIVNPEIWEGEFSIFSKFANNEKLIEAGEKGVEKVIEDLKKIL